MAWNKRVYVIRFHDLHAAMHSAGTGHHKTRHAGAVALQGEAHARKAPREGSGAAEAASWWLSASSQPRTWALNTTFGHLTRPAGLHRRPPTWQRRGLPAHYISKRDMNTAIEVFVQKQLNLHLHPGSACTTCTARTGRADQDPFTGCW